MLFRSDCGLFTFAVAHLDGNGFGDIQRRRVKTPADQIAFDDCIHEDRAAFLAILPAWLGSDPAAASSASSASPMMREASSEYRRRASANYSCNTRTENGASLARCALIR